MFEKSPAEQIAGGACCEILILCLKTITTGIILSLSIATVNTDVDRLKNRCYVYPPLFVALLFRVTWRFIMLVLSRKPEESILIDGNTTVKILEIRGGNKVRLGIEAPGHVHIIRTELVEGRHNDSSDETDSRADATHRRVERAEAV